MIDLERSKIMAKHKVEITGVTTANLKVLTTEETKKLFQKMKAGDPFARDELIEGNLKLVLSILKRFNQRGENMDDLFQVGCIGLVKAIDNFDLSQEVRLSTYAVPMILGEIKRYLRDNSSIRVSRSLKDLAYKTLKEKEEITNLTGKEASISEVAKKLEVQEADIIHALDAMKNPISIFEPIYNDGGDTIYLYDQIEDKKLVDRDLDTNMAVNQALQNLSSREQFIIDQRFMVGKTQMEIAEELGISQAQISRLEKGAIQSLKKVLK